MNSKKDLYYKYFDENILPQVQELEIQRVDLIKKVIISSIIYFLYSPVLRQRSL